jgi:hypothetical protein
MQITEQGISELLYKFPGAVQQDMCYHQAPPPPPRPMMLPAAFHTATESRSLHGVTRGSISAKNTWDCENWREA